MNIELIKQEIEKLSTLLSSWEEGIAVPAIERDLALEKLTKLYELVRFGELESSVAATITPIAAPAIEEKNEIEEDAAEQDVEVEFIFADEDEEEQESDEPAVSSAPEPIAEESMDVEPEPTAAIKPEPEPEVEVEPEKEEIPVEKTAEKPQRKPSMESLFGAEEIQRKPRSKHQRMMAIYSEPQQKPEKIVDISKIFDMDDDEDFEISVSSNDHVEEQLPQNTVNDVSSSETTILADTIAPSTTTLADTITAPAALAEEITHAQTKTLRQAIGINDKFLMTRDLFDGDNQAFEQAIAELDECETFDDCMIYIAENYEWNPDSEGAKFIIQLLERKHS